MTSSDIISALDKRFAGLEYTTFAELRVGTGYKNIRKGFNPEQRIDYFTLNNYPSNGFERIAYEIKVSRPDFLHEINNAQKRLQAMGLSNRFYFVVPVGLVDKKEIPEGCGLMEVDDGLNVRIIMKAPFREAANPNISFWCSALRQLKRSTKVLGGAEKHTLNEWAAIDGIKILDPDGFDRTDPNLYIRLFTREEFNQGIIRCTIMGKAMGGDGK